MPDPIIDGRQRRSIKGMPSEVVSTSVLSCD